MNIIYRKRSLNMFLLSSLICTYTCIFCRHKHVVETRIVTTRFRLIIKSWNYFILRSTKNSTKGTLICKNSIIIKLKILKNVTSTTKQIIYKNTMLWIWNIVKCWSLVEFHDLDSDTDLEEKKIRYQYCLKIL